MINNTQTQKKIIILFLALIIFLPWFNSNYFDAINPVELGTEDTSFYEINPCKISLVQFIANNFESIYQNHYYFRPNDKSPIQCFGRIAGVAVMQKELETQFIISVGTNALINLVFQGLFWVFIFSLVPKNKKSALSKNKFKNLGLIINLVIVKKLHYILYLISGFRNFFKLRKFFFIVF